MMQVVSRFSQGTLYGQKTAPTVTAEAIGSGVIGEGLIIAHVENTDPIYLGADNTVATSTGAQIAPGAIYTLDESNLDRVFCIAAVAGQKLSYIGKKVV